MEESKILIYFLKMSFRESLFRIVTFTRNFSKSEVVHKKKKSCLVNVFTKI